MREVIFRGKNTHNDEWKYGYLTYSRFDNAYSINDGNGVFDFVKKETIGQYTGLKDKNDKEIYEGDIVIADFDYELTPMEVIYYKCGFKLKSKDCKEPYDYSIHDETPELMVIGNIHDNPEFLEDRNEKVV